MIKFVKFNITFFTTIFSNPFLQTTYVYAVPGKPGTFSVHDDQTTSHMQFYLFTRNVVGKPIYEYGYKIALKIPTEFAISIIFLVWTTVKRVSVHISLATIYIGTTRTRNGCCIVKYGCYSYYIRTCRGFLTEWPNLVQSNRIFGHRTTARRPFGV